MSESEETKEFLPLPKFVGKVNDWIVHAIAMFGPKLAARLCLIEFPEYTNEELYGLYDDIFRKVYHRFLKYKSDPTSKNYKKLQDLEEAISMGLDDTIPYMYPMDRVKEYVRMLVEEEPTITQRITLINNIRREVGVEMRRSTQTESDNTTKWDQIEVMTEEQDTFSLAKQQKDKEKRLAEELAKNEDKEKNQEKRLAEELAKNEDKETV